MTGVGSFDVRYVQVERNMKTAEQREQKAALSQLMARNGYDELTMLPIGNAAVDVVYRKRVPM